RSHWSTSKTPSYTKSVSWQHHRIRRPKKNYDIKYVIFFSVKLNN
ncbi:MAG TPA: transposase, partial [Shigella sp.]|nr:transposase [Shigella sp.]